MLQGILLIVIVVLIVLSVGTGGRGRREKSGARGPQNSAGTRREAQDAKIREEDRYVEEQLGNGPGLSFRDLRPGTDEMDVLLRYNRARERELEESLENKEQKTG